MALKTIPECAKELGISASRLRRAAVSGQLSSLQLGNRLLVDPEDAKKALIKANSAKIGEVSAQTGLTETAIRRAVRDGWLPCDRSGKAYLFDINAVKDAITKKMQCQNIQK